MIYFGIDVHSNTHVVCRYDAETRQRDTVRYDNTESGRQALCDAVARDNGSVAMEACTGSRKLYDELQPVAQVVDLVDPRAFRSRFPKRGRKTDDIDAYNLARYSLEQHGGIWVPDHKTRERRALGQHWRGISKSLTLHKNTVHAHLKELHISHGHLPSLWTKKGLAWLESLAPRLTFVVSIAIRHALDNVKLLAQQKQHIEEAMAAEVEQDTDMQIIATHPGLGPVAAYILMAEIGDIKRFRFAKRLIGYAGLAPSVSQSGDRPAKTFWVTHDGRSLLRWIVVECALSAVKACPDLRNLYNRIVRRTKIKGKARVAVGNKLLIHVWHMLVKGEPYNKANEGKLSVKLAARKQKAARHVERLVDGLVRAAQDQTVVMGVNHKLWQDGRSGLGA